MNTISIAPAGKGQVTATSTDGHSFLTTTPLTDGARFGSKTAHIQTLPSLPSGPAAAVTGPCAQTSAKPPS
jgi:hypothetical protein